MAAEQYLSPRGDSQRGADTTASGSAGVAWVSAGAARPLTSSIHERATVSGAETDWRQRIGLHDFVSGALNGALKFDPLANRTVDVSVALASTACFKCEKQRLGIFRFMAHIFATYRFQVLVQILDPDTAADTRGRADWPDHFGPLKFTDHEDLALIFALLRVRLQLKLRARRVAPRC
jgi:hypothetical protein